MTMVQGTDAWYAARIGKVTASRVCDIVARTKSGVSASRAGYLGEIVAERLTGQSAASEYLNEDMRRGLDLEPAARFMYEVWTGQIVQTVGLIDHPRMPMCAASPDGTVGDDGLIEIKAPRTHVHIEYLLSGKPPAKYLPQMGWQCICTGRAWCDFVSFDPKMPPLLQLFVVRYMPDIGYLRELEAEVSAFIGEVDAKVEALRKLAA